MNSVLLLWKKMILKKQKNNIFNGPNMVQIKIKINIKHLIYFIII